MNRLVVVLFCFLSLLVSCSPVSAVEPMREGNAVKIDSLKQILSEDQLSDSARVSAYNRLEVLLRPTHPARALDYAYKSLDLLSEIATPVDVAYRMANIANIHYRMGNFSEAFENLLDARNVFLDAGDDYAYAYILNHMGILFLSQGHHDTSLEYFFPALRIYEELDSLTRQGLVLNNIGNAHLRKEDYRRAEQYHSRAIEIHERIGNQNNIALSLNNLGLTYAAMGDFDTAMEYYDRTLEIRERDGETRSLALVVGNIGNLYFEKGQYAMALEKLQEARDIFVRVDDQRGLAEVCFYLGNVHFAMGNGDKALFCYNNSLHAAKRIGLPAMVSDNYQAISNVMADKERFDSAYFYQGRFVELRDSIHDQAARQRALEMELLYDQERKEAELVLLRKTNQINELDMARQRLVRKYLVLLVAFVAILMGVIYYRYLEMRRKTRLLNAQKAEILQKNKKLQELNDRLVAEKRKVDELNKKLLDSEKHLILVNKTKDLFFSIISHDLRNPFASIVSFARILKRDIQNLSREQLQQLAGELDKSVLKINNLLENLLQWSRTQTGKIKYEPEYFDFKDIVRSNTKLFSATLQEKDLVLSDDTPENLIVWGDVNMTDTIVRNLLSNAIKYSHPGGRITLLAAVENGMVRITIGDEGVGISNEDQKKLFMIDTLYSTYGTMDEKGSGLGLLLCREFARKQGGEISFDSEEDKGSEFSFTLPLDDSRVG